MMYERGFGALANCFRGAGFMRGGLGGVLMILVVAAVVIGLVYVTKKSGKGKTDNEALNMLKLKYAQGDITEEEYLKRKNILQ